MKTMTFNLKELSLPLDRIKEEAANHWRLILLYLIFMVGCIAGSITYSNMANTFSEYIKKVIEIMIEASFSQNMCILSAAYLIPQVFLLLFSFSALGLPFIMLCPAACGLITSVIVSYFYCNFGVDGAVFSLIIILPCIVGFLLMLFIGANEGVILAEIVASNIFTNNKQGRGDVKDFLLRYVIIFLVCVFISALQAFCISNFGKTLLF